jgi:hypothetical protein
MADRISLPQRGFYRRIGSRVFVTLGATRIPGGQTGVQQNQVAKKSGLENLKLLICRVA